MGITKILRSEKQETEPLFQTPTPTKPLQNQNPCKSNSKSRLLEAPQQELAPQSFVQRGKLKSQNENTNRKKTGFQLNNGTTVIEKSKENKIEKNHLLASLNLTHKQDS